MAHVWVVEAKPVFSRRSEWRPCLGFPGVPGVHRVRSSARAAAKRMFQENTYNRSPYGYVSVRHRASKYVREG